MTDQGIGSGGDQLVDQLNGYGAAPVAGEVLARPDGEEKADDGKNSPNRKGPDARWPELAVTIRRPRARRTREAAGSTRWVVLLPADLIPPNGEERRSMPRERKIQRTRAFQDLRALSPTQSYAYLKSE
jgi:hypothetical protein